MTASPLDKYLGSRKATGTANDTEPTSDAEGTEDLGCFGWLRGIRDRAISLELRKKDGTIIAISYAWIERAEFDPSTGIVIQAGGQKVTIKGRNLNGELRSAIRLFQGITRHRVPWVQEADEAAAMAAEDRATVVESIAVR